EADRTREAGGKLAMDLALGRAGADCAPRDEIRDVLRCDDVQELASHRQAELVDVDQQAARQPEAVVDAEASVEVRIVDEALPSDRRPRLLEVDAHDDLELSAQSHAFARQALRIFARGVHVVYRAWSDHD